VINSQKVQATAAQHRWIYHHKHLFAPLVGPKSYFLSNLDTEIKGLAPEKRVIVEFEEIEKQPKLIKGGQMKDYQVSGGCEGTLDATKPHRSSSCKGYPSSPGCIKMVRSSVLRDLPWFNFKSGMNSVLGDEMGLGKTLQVSPFHCKCNAVAHD
jgi:SWI/SNF-related matrix-associated actin-dependent regulator of chromatin subfamily A member 5